jgi:hypothetical protein
MPGGTAIPSIGPEPAISPASNSPSQHDQELASRVSTGDLLVRDRVVGALAIESLMTAPGVGFLLAFGGVLTLPVAFELGGPAPRKATTEFQKTNRAICLYDVVRPDKEYSAPLHDLINNTQVPASRHSAGAVIAPTIDRI